MWTDHRKAVLDRLSDRYPWKEKLLYREEVDSTNTRLKELARLGAPQGIAMIAAAQTLGRGRMGRSFHSPTNSGVYLSLLLRPGCPPGQLMHLTCAVGVAMCDAVEQVCGIRPRIKWINDLIYGTKKLGGILVEMGLSPTGAVDYAVIGVGINLSQKEQDFPEELRDKACSLEMLTKAPVSADRLSAAMLDALYAMSETLLNRQVETMQRYREDCVTLGKEVSLVRQGTVLHGKALEVDDQGALVVCFPDGTTQAVSAGEVSVRGLYGYV